MIGFLKSRVASIGYALAGLGFILRSQHNAKVHLAMACSVVLAGLAVGLSRDDWLWVALAITLVWFAEAMNTGFEYLCDVVSPEFSERVGRAKDIAAGAVLICAVFAVVVGLVVFVPHLVG